GRARIARMLEMSIGGPQEVGQELDGNFERDLDHARTALARGLEKSGPIARAADQDPHRLHRGSTRTEVEREFRIAPIGFERFRACAHRRLIDLPVLGGTAEAHDLDVERRPGPLPEPLGERFVVVVVAEKARLVELERFERLDDGPLGPSAAARSVEVRSPDPREQNPFHGDHDTRFIIYDTRLLMFGTGCASAPRTSRPANILLCQYLRMSISRGTLAAQWRLTATNRLSGADRSPV